MPDAERIILTCISLDGARVLVIPLTIAVAELTQYLELLSGEEEIEDNSRPQAHLTTAEWLERDLPDLLMRCDSADDSSGFTGYEPARLVQPGERDAIEAALRALGYRVLHAPSLANDYLHGPGYGVEAALLDGATDSEAR